MNSPWHDFLLSRSARIASAGHLSFPASSRDAATDRLFALTDFGVVAVNGQDAAQFLQGQLTNDVRELSPTHTQMSGHCNQKGRLLASMRALLIDRTYYLLLPRERIPDLLARLRKFVLRSKVTLEEVSDARPLIALAGAGTAARLTAAGLAVPAPEHDLATTADQAVVRLPGQVPRWLVCGPVEAQCALWDRLAADATPADGAEWSLLDIQAGIPWVRATAAEQFIPQMINLHLLDGVSFTKGCYTGQEVVARMQYLGKLKRRMYLAELAADTPPPPGTVLFSPTSTSQQSCGWVVDAATSGPGQQTLLAVVEIAAAEDGEVRLGEQGPRLHCLPPPYGFPPAEPAAGST